MLLVLELDVADLAATRFAISPLCETLRAVALLGRPDPPAVNWPWVRWARGELERRPLRLPRLWPLVVTDLPYWPEFLVPAPTGKSPGFDEELARMYATPDEPVRASLRRVFGAGPWPDTAKDLFERPQESLAEIAAELAECHDRLIVPHWERMRSVLDADVAHHAGLLASGGARSLFSDLHPGLRWADGKLFMTDAEDGLNRQVMLGPDGLVLVPSVFIWPEWSVKKSTSTQTTLLYPARGVARVWDDLGPGDSGGARDLAAVEALLGGPRARLLIALRSPATTSALAGRFGVTPGAVSQHLAVLHRGGLVDRQRSGRTVLYQASKLGLALLEAGS
jgi:DNA-binding transcriptional ArsR family regulator